MPRDPGDCRALVLEARPELGRHRARVRGPSEEPVANARHHVVARVAYPARNEPQEPPHHLPASANALEHVHHRRAAHGVRATMLSGNPAREAAGTRRRKPSLSRAANRKREPSASWAMAKRTARWQS